MSRPDQGGRVRNTLGVGMSVGTGPRGKGAELRLLPALVSLEPCVVCAAPRGGQSAWCGPTQPLAVEAPVPLGQGDQAASGSSVFVGGGGGCHRAPSPPASFILSPRRQGAGVGSTWLCPLPPKAPFPRGGGLPSAWLAQEGGKSCHPPPPPTSLRPERGVRTGDVSRAAGEDTCLCCSPFRPSPGK